MVSVSLSNTAQGIDFVLDPHGGITGTVTDEQTGNPLDHARVQVWHSDKGQVSTAFTDPMGVYVSSDLDAGTYYVVTDEGAPYLDELWDGFPCPGGPPWKGRSSGCDPTKGTPIEVNPGGITPSIDLDLTNLSLVIFTDGFETGSTAAWSPAGP